MQEQGLLSTPLPYLVSLPSLFHHMSNLPSHSPLSSTILVHKKGMDLKNLRCTKKGGNVVEEGTRPHKKKDNYFLFINL
jgi:hypothetical protein